MSGFTIDRRQFIVELAAAEPTLKRDAEAALKTQLFDPAVKDLQAGFEGSLVTQELDQASQNPDAGLNLSGTLDSDIPFETDNRDKNAIPNLFSFIGFDAGTKPTDEVREFLHVRPDGDGPQLKYQGLNRTDMTFRFQVSAPNWAAIERATPLPWTEGGGISWARRIEQGIPGLGQFLNAIRPSPDPSRSGGGIQVEGQLRGGTYRATQYLSDLFKRFIQRFSGSSAAGSVYTE